jgi:nitrate reductase beta subunit
MRIPVDYLANLLSAGDGEVIRGVLHRLAAMRGHMRKREVLGEHDEAMPESVGMSVEDVEDMYRLLAIADYDDRYVIPQAHAELGDRLMEQQGTCGLDFEGGPGNCGMVVPESEADTEGFMLEEEPRLDLVRMAGGRRRRGEERG